MSMNTALISESSKDTFKNIILQTDTIACGVISLKITDWQISFRCTQCGEVEYAFEMFLKHLLFHFDSLEMEDVENIYKAMLMQTLSQSEQKEDDVADEDLCDNVYIEVEDNLIKNKFISEDEDEQEEEIGTVQYVEDELVEAVEALIEEKSDSGEYFTLKIEENINIEGVSAVKEGHEFSDLAAEDELQQLETFILESEKATQLKVKEPRNHKHRSKTKNLKCDICGKAFRAPSDLLRHRNGHMGIKPFSCDMCTLSFTEVGNLKSHKQRVHDGIRPYLCNDCGKAFFSNTELNTHLRIHSKETPFPCTECPRAFATRSYLNLHLRRHRNDKPHKCDFCGKRFFLKQLLRDHLLTHSNKRSHECPVCNATFLRKYDVKIHMKVHTGLKEHTCTICKAEFVQKWNLTTHMKRLHPNALK